MCCQAFNCQHRKHEFVKRKFQCFERLFTPYVQGFSYSTLRQVSIKLLKMWDLCGDRWISLNSRLRGPRDAHNGFKCYTLLAAGLLLEAKYLNYHVRRIRSAVRVLQWNSQQHNDEAGQWPWASQSYVTRSTISLSPTVLGDHMRYPRGGKHCASRFTCDFRFTFQSPEVISLSLFSPLKLRICNMHEQGSGTYSKLAFSQIC